MPLAQPFAPPAAQCMKRLDNSSSDEEARALADRPSPPRRVLASKDMNSPVPSTACAPAPLPTSVPRAHAPTAKRQLVADAAAVALEAQMARTQAAAPMALSLPYVVDDPVGGTVDDPGSGTQAATAAATTTQPPPANKTRMRATRAAAVDDEEVEGARVPAAAASGRAPAAAEDNSLKPRSLYECIELASEGSKHASTILNISVDGWIDVYKSNAASGLVAWANVAVRAGGRDGPSEPLECHRWPLIVYDCVRHQVRAGGIEMGRLSLTDLPKLPEGADPIEELLTEEKREMLITAASDNGWYVEPYPLSDKKLTKAFKRGLWKLMETLLEKVKQEILFDKVLMPWLLEWLMICSEVHASAQHGAQHGTQPLCAAAT